MDDPECGRSEKKGSACFTLGRLAVAALAAMPICKGLVFSSVSHKT